MAKIIFVLSLCVVISIITYVFYDVFGIIGLVGAIAIFALGISGCYLEIEEHREINK